MKWIDELKDCYDLSDPDQIEHIISELRGSQAFIRDEIKALFAKDSEIAIEIQRLNQRIKKEVAA